MTVQVCAQRGQIRASHADLAAMAGVGEVYLLEFRYTSLSKCISHMKSDLAQTGFSG
jgi:hypothetical protein